MKLYHGTNSEVARKALQHGLQPRALHGGSNWKHTIESNPDCVYLTDVYGPYFAWCATKTEGHQVALVEVETDLLEQGSLLPDEDFLEQVSRGNGSVWRELKKMSMLKRTAHLRGLMKHNARFWADSVKHLGTCAHQGAISPQAITRITLFDPRSNPQLWSEAIQPTITLLNHQFCASKYALLTRWLMGDAVDVDQYLAAELHLPGDTGRERIRELLRAVYPDADALAQRTAELLTATHGITRLK